MLAWLWDLLMAMLYGGCMWTSWTCVGAQCVVAFW